MIQQSLFEPSLANPVAARGDSRIDARQSGTPRFDGKTYDPKLDQQRLKAQFHVVFELMKDGKWRTLAEIAKLTNNPEASVSARLRDLRKPRFGSWSVDRRRVMNGLFEYKVSR